jgi:phosphotransferase system enzyme I (PtsI)
MKGTGISPGISIGKALVIKTKAHEAPVLSVESDQQKIAEIKGFDKAVENAVNEINRIIEKYGSGFRPDDISILETQTEFIGDSQLRSDVIERINNENITAASAVRIVISEMVKVFSEMNDEYLRSRATDIQDAGNRIVRHLLRNEEFSLSVREKNTILISSDITPTEALTIDTSMITGIVTSEGGKTSHAAIIARSRSIPAVAECGPDVLEIYNDVTLIIDGSAGEVIVNPDMKTIREFEAKKRIFDEKTEILKSLRDKPAVTKDGKKITLNGNISNHNEVEHLIDCGGEGIGLLRTELFFMTSENFPTEEEQFEFYLQVAIASGKKPVIIRTLDIGGDKQLPYFKLPPEANPFLGFRAIRISLERQDLFLTQVRAILRASVYGNLKIMLPMIADISELRTAKGLIEKAKGELSARGLRFRENTETGIMLEIPCAAIMTGLLAGESDFFSIGTNDLCQYSMAVDRMNSKVSALYDHFNPGFLRIVSTAIEQGHKHNRPVGMCGEMASDPLAIPLLIGMGLTEFSMPASSIPNAKQVITSCSHSNCASIWKKVQKLDNSEDIRNLLISEKI